MLPTQPIFTTTLNVGQYRQHGQYCQSNLLQSLIIRPGPATSNLLASCQPNQLLQSSRFMPAKPTPSSVVLSAARLELPDPDPPASQYASAVLRAYLNYHCSQHHSRLGEAVKRGSHRDGTAALRVREEGDDPMATRPRGAVTRTVGPWRPFPKLMTGIGKSYSLRPDETCCR